MRVVRHLLLLICILGAEAKLFEYLSSRSPDRADRSPTELPDIRGVVTSVLGGTIRVEVNSDEPSGSPKAQVTIPQGIAVIDRSGHVYDREAIHEGSIVSVWFTGPVAESYPVQAMARAVTLEGPWHVGHSCVPPLLSSH